MFMGPTDISGLCDATCMFTRFTPVCATFPVCNRSAGRATAKPARGLRTVEAIADGSGHRNRPRFDRRLRVVAPPSRLFPERGSHLPNAGRDVRASWHLRHHGARPRRDPAPRHGLPVARRLTCRSAAFSSVRITSSRRSRDRVARPTSRGSKRSPRLLRR